MPEFTIRTNSGRQKISSPQFTAAVTKFRASLQPADCNDSNVKLDTIIGLCKQELKVNSDYKAVLRKYALVTIILSVGIDNITNNVITASLRVLEAIYDRADTIYKIPPLADYLSSIFQVAIRQLHLDKFEGLPNIVEYKALQCDNCDIADTNEYTPGALPNIIDKKCRCLIIAKPI